MNGIKISKSKISNFINHKRKKLSHYFCIKRRLNENQGKICTVSHLSKVKILVIRENSLMQKSIAKCLNTFVATLNKIVIQDLQL